jgi:hypothetical protein
MTDLQVSLHPVSFALEDGPPRLVSLTHEDGRPLSRIVRRDVEGTARALLADTLKELAATGLLEASTSARDDLCALGGRFLALAGAQPSSRSVVLVYTAVIPTPLAEAELDITAGSPYAWRTMNTSRGRRDDRRTPKRRSGEDALVLEYWRQAFEETDVALDFLPEFLSLPQLRSLYDAVWGYDQDPSGFKRWAIDRKGAFQNLLDEVTEPAILDTAFYESLGRRLPAEQAAKAGAISAGGLTAAPTPALALPIGLSAAVVVNKLYRRRGPDPTWLTKSEEWQQGPTWIDNLYPPRPNWTRWDIRHHA